VKLVEVLAQDSTAAIDWVTLFGVDLDVLSKCGGHSVSLFFYSLISKCFPSSRARTARASTRKVALVTLDGRLFQSLSITSTPCLEKELHQFTVPK